MNAHPAVVTFLWVAIVLGVLGIVLDVIDLIRDPGRHPRRDRP